MTIRCQLPRVGTVLASLAIGALISIGVTPTHSNAPPKPHPCDNTVLLFEKYDWKVHCLRAGSDGLYANLSTSCANECEALMHAQHVAAGRSTRSSDNVRRLEEGETPDAGVTTSVAKPTCKCKQGITTDNKKCECGLCGVAVSEDCGYFNQNGDWISCVTCLKASNTCNSKTIINNDNGCYYEEVDTQPTPIPTQDPSDPP